MTTKREALSIVGSLKTLSSLSKTIIWVFKLFLFEGNKHIGIRAGRHRFSRIGYRL